jgi:acyl-CoA thioesterase-1
MRKTIRPGGRGKMLGTSRRYGPAGQAVNAGGRRLAFAAALLFSGLAVLMARPAGLSAAEPVRLMVLGDSLTAGYGLPESDGFPAKLEAALRAHGYAVEVLDAGVSGDTTAGGLARLPWLLDGPPANLPDAVMVELGGNDGLRGLDPQAMYANLDAVLTLLADRGVPALLTGMKAPPNLGAEYGRAFEAVFHRLADKHDVALYPFFLEGVALVPRLNQPDGIHPNAEGVAEIVRRILPATKAFLDSLPVDAAAR